MIRLCTNCEKQAEFKETSKEKKFICNECNAIMHKCRGKDCNYMIPSWFYCSKCINGGLKKMGLGVAVIGLVPVAIIATVLASGDDKKDS